MDRNELALRMAELKFVKIGSDTAENVAIVALNARRNYERPTEVQVFARLGYERMAVAFWFLCTGVLIERARAALPASTPASA